MGLDVYLYRFDNKADTDARESEYERLSSEHWAAIGKPYESMTEVEKHAVSQSNVAVAERLGLGRYGTDERQKQDVAIDSTQYPEHLFKVGYFRSSYNEGGINAVLRARIGITLADILGTDGQTYEFQPDWAESRNRATGALVALRTANREKPYRASTVGPRLFGGDTAVDTEAAALDVFLRVKSAEHSFGSFSCRDGEFWLDQPMRVRGAIIGRNSLGVGCVYLVYEDDAENRAWYEQALEIVIETCDYVLARADRDKYWLHWSG